MLNRLISLVFLLIFFIISKAYSNNDFILPAKKPSIFKKVDKIDIESKNLELPQKKPKIEISETLEKTVKKEQKTKKHDEETKRTFEKESEKQL